MANTLSKGERRKRRTQRARQWLTTYEGNNPVRAYRKKFHVDNLTAAKDLQRAGMQFKPGYLEALQKSEESRIRNKREKEREKKEKEFWSAYEDSDDTYAFIAGYTSNGVPFGVSWEELDLEPYASHEELMAAYDRMVRKKVTYTRIS